MRSTFVSNQVMLQSGWLLLCTKQTEKLRVLEPEKYFVLWKE